MARKSRKNIPEVVSSATIQTEVSRPFRAGLYARISMETEETLERGTIETQVELMKTLWQIRKTSQLQKYIRILIILVQISTVLVLRR